MSSFNGSSYDTHLLQSLMSRLQLRPPYLDTNSFLSQSLDDFLLPSDQEDEDEEDDNSAGDDEEEEEDEEGSRQAKQRKLLAKEEAKLEREIIKIIHAGKGQETLKANSGQSVAIGDHNICVSIHEEIGSDYRVWEWHGHIMFLDEVDGYSAEYIYGNYFERLLEKITRKPEEEEEDDEEVEESKFEGEGNSGLKDLIEGLDNLMAGSGSSSSSGGQRIVHRNSLNAAK